MTNAIRWESPTVDLVVLVVIIFIIQETVALIGFGLEMFALTLPLTVRPWTIVTSVYSHGNAGHLFANVVALVIFGLLLERSTTRLRFHAFVLGTGIIAGVAEVLVGGALGQPPLVLGISGAVFALMGYIVVANPVSSAILGRFNPSRRVQFILMIVLAIGVTLVTAAEGVALIAHFFGFVVGLISGRFRILRSMRR